MSGFFPRNDQLLQQERAKDAKEELERAENGVQVYFLKSGTTVVRILPPYNERGVWFREIQEHNLQVAGRWLSATCPRPFGQVCPICNHGESIAQARTEEALEESRPFRPATRFLFNALVLSDDKGTTAAKGLYVLKTGITVKRGLLLLDTHASYSDITNLDSGFDVSIMRSGTGLDTKYNVLPIPERTSVNQNLMNQGLNPQAILIPYDLDTLFPPKSADELQAMLEGKQAAPGFPAQARPAPAPAPVAAPAPAPQPVPVATPQPVPVTTTTGPQPVTVNNPTPAPTLPPPPEEPK